MKTVDNSFQMYVMLTTVARTKCTKLRDKSYFEKYIYERIILNNNSFQLRPTQFTLGCVKLTDTFRDFRILLFSHLSASSIEAITNAAEIKFTKYESVD